MTLHMYDIHIIHHTCLELNALPFICKYAYYSVIYAFILRMTMSSMEFQETRLRSSKNLKKHILTVKDTNISLFIMILYLFARYLTHQFNSITKANQDTNIACCYYAY